jgi:hypothetical protein
VLHTKNDVINNCPNSKLAELFGSVGRFKVVICCYKEGREERNDILSYIKIFISSIYLSLTSSFSLHKASAR